MRIAIDVSQIIYGTGVSTYVRNLVKNLSKLDKQGLPPNGEEIKYILFGGSLRRFQDLKEILHKYHTTRLPKPGTGGQAVYASNVETRVYPIAPTLADLIWNRLHMFPVENLLGKIDVFHSSDWTQPPSRAFKVTTVHDLAPIKFPKQTPVKIVSVHKARLGWVKKEVDRIIVPSGSTKLDLISEGFVENKIRVIPEGVDETFMPQPKSKIGLVKKKYGIDGEYFLTIGIGERKNTRRIVEVFRKHDTNFELVLVGTPPSDIKINRGMKVIERISDEDLPVLYSGAAVLLYPSLYEGFGIPILEAMASGCPVVTSNVSSMPEVAKDAAVLVDPYDQDSISEGIDKALKSKEVLIAKGFERVKEFSWQKTAEETLRVYKEI